MNIKLYEAIKHADEVGNYLLTLTTYDKNKTENNLTHQVIRKEFPVDDIVPSLDSAIRLLRISPETPLTEYVHPEAQPEGKPLKIAIVTHFNKCPDSYSPGKAVKNQIKILRQHGHEVVFFTQEGSTMNVGCEMRPVVPKFKREKNVVNEEVKKKFIEVLKRELTPDFDLAITHDLYIDDCITYREGIRECGLPINWLHWARSGVGHPIDFSMPNARFVYMNISDRERFARAIGVKSDRVRVVFNEKEPSILFKWHPITTHISDKLRLYEKDIIQVYPMCTTRMDAKGINCVIRTFGELKKAGKKVALIICNSNGRKRIDEIAHKIELAKQTGLDEGDILFTSTLPIIAVDDVNYSTESEIPNIVVAELMRMANLFIFPTLAEVCSNVLLEASMTKNLIVLNQDLPSLYDFVDKDAVLNFPFTSLQSIHYSNKTDKDYRELALTIIVNLMQNKADRQFRKVWSVHNAHSIYYNQLAPLLYERD